MSVDGPAAELEALDHGIAALEQQREALGDAVVDTALRPLLARRRRLSEHPGDRRKVVTVLFSDLADPTPLTAALGDKVMARYYLSRGRRSRVRGLRLAPRHAPGSALAGPCLRRPVSRR